jgi:hypothetical protein
LSGRSRTLKKPVSSVLDAAAGLAMHGAYLCATVERIPVIDEAAGREMARRLGLLPLGMLGTLVRAKQRGLRQKR